MSVVYLAIANQFGSPNGGFMNLSNYGRISDDYVVTLRL